MPYKYDVFISYRRLAIWSSWLYDKVLPDFKELLAEELGREPNIYIDKVEIKSGQRWDVNIFQNLARSRVLVPLWSRQYFTSDWCKFELAHMLARQEMCNFGSDSNFQSLIVPATIHDGKDLPECINCIQYASLNEFANPRISENSRKWEELFETLKQWIPEVVEAINSAPDYDPKWEGLLKDDQTVIGFMGKLTSPNPKQKVVPSLG